MDPNQEPTQSPEERAQLLGFTPAALRAWFRAVPGWRSFDGAYLVAWGARNLPDVSHTHWWLWLTSGMHAWQCSLCSLKHFAAAWVSNDKSFAGLYETPMRKGATQSFGS